MQKILIGVLALGTAVLAVVCVLQSRQLRDSQQRTLAAEQAVAAGTEAQQAQAERVQQLERVNRRLEQQVEKFTSVTTTLRSNEVRQSSNATAWATQLRAAQKAGGPDGSNGGEGFFGKEMGEMLEQMMKDPAMRDMIREQQKAAINMMYGSLFKEMKLTPEEREKLKTILSDAQMKNIENAQGLFGGEKKEGVMEDAQKLVNESKKQTEAEIKALLGDERFAQYDDYQKNIGERMQLDQFKARLEAANLPLADQQMAQMMSIMREEKAAVPPVFPTDNTQMPTKEMMTPENMDKQMAWMEDYNRRVAERAAQVLTPEQLKPYREFLDQQAAMQKMGLKMARQMFGGKATGAK